MNKRRDEGQRRAGSLGAVDCLTPGRPSWGTSQSPLRVRVGETETEGEHVGERGGRGKRQESKCRGGDVMGSR